MSKMKELFGNRLTIKENKGTKSRYYYILAQNKKEKKEILSKIKVKSQPFPKGDNTRYDLYEDNGFAFLEKKDKQLTIFDLKSEGDE